MSNTMRDLNIEQNADKAVNALRKGALAYVGMHGIAFEFAKERFEMARKSFEDARKSTDGLFDRFVKKGEELEAQAGETLQDVRARVKGFTANDRTVEIKVETKSTKAAKKTAAKKPATKKATVKATAKTKKKAA